MTKEIDKNQLPKDWKWLKLGNVGKIETGTTPNKSNKEYYGKEIPFFKPTDLQQGINTIIASDNLSKLGFEKTRKLPKDSILVTCIGATIGKTGLIKIEGASNQQINSIIPNIHHNSKFVYYQVISNSFQNQIKDNSSSTTLPILNKSKFQQLDFLTTTPEVQQAIVSKIEELFSELDKGIENLRTAQQQLKTYRQSVLKWAFEGRLTNENVKDGELTKGWKLVFIEDIATVGTGATPLKSRSDYYGGNIAWVTSGALNDEYVTEATDFVTQTAVKETNLSVYPKHTLLVAMYGEGKTRGKCSELLIEACTNQAIAAIYFDEKQEPIKSYLKYFLLKNYTNVRKKSSGGVQPNLNLGIIKKLQFPLAPFKEQRAIINEIESRLSVADKMEESITQSLQQAEGLRQSILKKAFEGKLINNI